VVDFVRRILDAQRPSLFLADFLPFQQRIATLGMVNSLAQLVLKLTIPGIPDIYQGTELWDLSLVDPDNRRAVDYDARRRSLSEDMPVAALLADWPDGRIKQRLLRILLDHRREHRALYDAGTYRALKASGARADHLLAFSRADEPHEIVAAVPLLFARLLEGLTLPVGASVWQNTVLPIEDGRWRDLFTGTVLEIGDHQAGRGVLVADLLSRLPVACLERVG
jgi:(1->4)-alpha-D-glucan 1-alpha-D-glucosylmutase